ncbi:MAG: glycosyltransferase family 1 protein [Oscillospiraceae bacterium]|nr:glycosyltransferase family 1 protein [Oscillospiraceae bacterium]
MYNVLPYMDPQIMEVDVVASDLAESVFSESLRQRGIRFYALSGAQRNLPENYRLFRRLLHSRQYDVVHLHIFHSLSLVYARLARDAGVTVRIAHSHNTALRSSPLRPLKLLLHRAARALLTNCATDLWACSGAAADFLFSAKALRRRGFQWIPNGIHTELFRFDAGGRAAARRELGLSDELLVGNIGRLCAQKNQAFLLDAFAALLAGRPESRLLLVGEGEAEEALRRKAEQLGCGDKVIFYGVSSHVERLLWAMDVFAFPSRFEGLGIAAVEAQAAGLPVLASEHVPPEAGVTPLLQALPLDAGAAGWAQALQALCRPSGRREDWAAAVRRGGFDVADAAARIQAYYGRSLSDELS